MYDLYKIKDIKFLLEKHNFKFSKGLGQNFICSPYICPRMVEESGISKNTGVIEIGPGIGVLTREIAKKAKKVISIEIDKRLLPILFETTSELKNVKILNEDVLKIDLDALICSELKEASDIKICANLPYFITSQIIIKCLEAKNSNINSLTFMVQKEAGDRLCALPGDRDCGAISLIVQYYAEAEVLFGVSRSNFIPVPNVDSSVIKIVINRQKSRNIKDKNIFFDIVKHTFMHRRKTLLNTLSGRFKIEKDELSKLLISFDIPPNNRPEQLSFEDFVHISNGIHDRIIQNGYKYNTKCSAY